MKSLIIAMALLFYPILSIDGISLAETKIMENYTIYKDIRENFLTDEEMINLRQKTIESLKEEPDTYNKTMRINKNDLSIIYNSNTNLEGKKITCIGDSITFGNGGSEVSENKNISYCDFLALTLNCEVVNLGIGGSAIGDYWDETSLILRWQEIPQDSDIIVVFAGVNDFFIGPEHFGDIETDKTFCHDTYELLANIKTNYPNSQVFVCTTFKNNAENWEPFANYNLPMYMDKLKEYAGWMGFEIIDMYELGFMNSQIPEIKENFVPDDIHPNDAGNKILADRIAAEICIKYKGQE